MCRFQNSVVCVTSLCSNHVWIFCVCFKACSVSLYVLKPVWLCVCESQNMFGISAYALKPGLKFACILGSVGFEIQCLLLLVRGSGEDVGEGLRNI